jgi:hypothetical protein
MAQYNLVTRIYKICKHGLSNKYSYPAIIEVYHNHCSLFLQNHWSALTQQGWPKLLSFSIIACTRTVWTAWTVSGITRSQKEEAVWNCHVHFHVWHCTVNCHSFPSVYIPPYVGCTSVWFLVSRHLCAYQGSFQPPLLLEQIAPSFSCLSRSTQPLWE